MNDKKIHSGAGRILKRVAERIGAKVMIEPRWGVVGQINFLSGKKRYFRFSSLDLNPHGSSVISIDKDYANFFMKKMGYSVIKGKAFLSSDWAKTIGAKQTKKEIYDFAHQIGYPIIVKPNSGSHGNGVFMAYNQKELQQALDYIFPKDNIALIQKFITGNDYRIVVLDDKIISAYQRLPFCIVGDAKNNIERLIVKKIKTLADLNRPVNIKISDQRILQNLKRQKLNLKSVLRKDEKIYLLNNANLSSGGDALDVTNIIHPEFKKLAIQLTKDMGLRLCGVDLMVQGGISEKIKKYWIIEINSSPGLDHYLKIGKNQEKIVENMYLKVLKAMEKY